MDVLFPVPGAYDETGDSLVDLRVQWGDSGTGVDPASARLQSLSSGDTTNLLLGHWQLGQRDAGGLVAHESRTRPLRGGTHLIEISIADMAGNRTADTIIIQLPHAAIIDSITDGTSTVGHITGIVICPDDGRLYATRNNSLLVADPDLLTFIGVFTDRQAGGPFIHPLCIPGDSIVYATDRVNRFNRNTMTFLPPISGTFVSEGFVASRAVIPSRLYVAERHSGGDVVVVDRISNRRLGSLGIPPSPWQEDQVYAMAILDLDTKLYVARKTQGLLVVRPNTGQIIPPDLGTGINSMRLSADDVTLYTVGDDGWLVQFDTRTDLEVRSLHLTDGLLKVMALSPSERRIFVTAYDWFPEAPSAENVLVDVVGWRVLATFSRPRLPDTNRYDGGVVFHPNGTVFFAGHDAHIDVYLNRE